MEPKPRKQYAALPYVVFARHIEVLLITRRRSNRWIIPKGWPEKDLSAPQLAMLEAYEEAGLKGKVGKKSIGNFTYLKQLDDGNKVTCSVDVFPFSVSTQYLDWPEKGERQLRWVKLKKASELIDQPDLATLILQFNPVKKTKRKKKKTKDKNKQIKGGKSKTKTKSKSKDQISNKIRATL